MAALPRRRDDHAASAVIGAIIILAVLGTAIVTINAVHVPRQGEAAEASHQQDVQRALAELVDAQAVAGADATSRVHVPLRPVAIGPRLVAGIILDPVRAGGSLDFTPDDTSVRLALILDVPPAGVPAGDPSREDVGNGTMRVWLVGNRDGGEPIGTLTAIVGGAYLTPQHYVVEGGALLSGSGAVIVAPPIRVRQQSDGASAWTSVSIRLPILEGGGAQLGGAEAASISLVNGGLANAGGSSARARAIIFEVEGPRADAWHDALASVGASATANSTHATGTWFGPTMGASADLAPSITVARADVVLAARS